MALLPQLVIAATWPKYRQFVADARQPDATQAWVWREIRREIAEAPFWRGRFHAALRDFPITDYEDYRAAIARSLHSGVSELSGARVEFWAESAGTSNAPKRFPLTALQRRQFQRTTPPFMHGLLRRFPRVLSAPILYFAATTPIARAPSGADIGFISHFNYRTTSAFARRLYCLPLAAFSDDDTFAEYAPLYALCRDLSCMIAVTPGQIQRFGESVRNNAPALLQRLQNGTVKPSMPPLRVSAQRLRYLREIFARCDFILGDVWPSLQCITTWTAATCGLQAQALRPLFGDKVTVVDATYSATEGWMNVPLGNAPGGPLHPRAHVMEFADIDAPIDEAHLLPLSQLQPGRRYEIFLTTAMGFVRYRLGDIVRCTGLFEKTPMIAFEQKAGSVVSLGLVQIAETEITQALIEARFSPRGQWCFAPNRQGDGLVFYSDVEVDSAALATVHAALRKLNRYYDAYAEKTLVKPIAFERGQWHRSTHAQSKPHTLLQMPPF